MLIVSAFTRQLKNFKSGAFRSQYGDAILSRHRRRCGVAKNVTAAAVTELSPGTMFGLLFATHGSHVSHLCANELNRQHDPFRLCAVQNAQSYPGQSGLCGNAELPRCSSVVVRDHARSACAIAFASSVAIRSATACSFTNAGTFTGAGARPFAGTCR
jgi:hypothetical protein